MFMVRKRLIYNEESLANRTELDPLAVKNNLANEAQFLK